MTDERAAPYDDEDNPEQQARCRALEMMVLLRALLDATWDEDRGAEISTLSALHRWRMRLGTTRRASARAWFLEGGDAQKKHVDGIAACAGLPDGWIWILVERFIRNREIPEPLHRLYDMMVDRPGTKKFDFDVAFVA